MALPKIDPISTILTDELLNSSFGAFDVIETSNKSDVRNKNDVKVIDHDTELFELLAFFQNFIPDRNWVNLNPWTTITDQKKFIDYSIGVIKNQKTTSPVYKNELDRLKNYYKIISS